jgi:branched-chain amino acid transport system substrate-binding protein
VQPLFALFLSFLASAYGGAASAQVSDDAVRIGVLGDLSGPCADLGGPGNVTATRMAVEDAGSKVLRKPIDVVTADHQNKADVGAAIARQWFDGDKVDMVIISENSSIALAVEQVAFQKNRIALAGAVATTLFTGKNCTSNEAAWLHDNYALANTLARSVVGRGGDTWFFITVDYTFGHSWRLKPKTPFWPAAEKC